MWTEVINSRRNGHFNLLAMWAILGWGGNSDSPTHKNIGDLFNHFISTLVPMNQNACKILRHPFSFG